MLSSKGQAWNSNPRVIGLIPGLSINFFVIIYLGNCVLVILSLTSDSEQKTMNEYLDTVTRRKIGC